ncbi:hypothetical protein NVP1244A_087 [Vibrio phage 1.244.A._10N.261.54.C3]|nr:hypothetical protein NVP1244A_087 [Vibrio phage 1.244.A._10N.261.54.C3]AUR98715.1 hypothetical protein NVP1255O_087 [Vibrio phage 1.255.O._10N.286.45.F1]
MGTTKKMHDIKVASQLLKNGRGDVDINFTKNGVSIGIPSSSNRQHISTCLDSAGIHFNLMKTRVIMNPKSIKGLMLLIILLVEMDNDIAYEAVKLDGHRYTYRCNLVPSLIKQYVEAYHFISDTARVFKDEPQQLDINVSNQPTHLQVGRTTIDITCEGYDLITATRG